MKASQRKRRIATPGISIARLAVRPGEALIVRMAGNTANADLDMAAKYFHAAFPGVPVMLTTEPVSVAAIAAPVPERIVLSGAKLSDADREALEAYLRSKPDFGVAGVAV
jgi:hypothetical protein